MRKNVLAVVSINLLQPGPALSFFNVFFDSHYNEKSLVYFILSTIFKMTVTGLREKLIRR